jgi:hypothetical protein
MILFNFYIWISRKPGRADKSAPTDIPINLLITIIGDVHDESAPKDNQIMR